MHRSTCTTALAAALLLAGCADSSQPTAPTDANAARGGIAQAGGQTRLITMMDACDPTTFNAALSDPEACIRNGGVTFQNFLDQLADHGFAGAWHFAPPRVEARVGQTLLAINRGGEVHTFTEVEEFGGGIIDPLNALTGNTTVAPECLALAPSDFIPPGGAATDEVEEAGVEKYQCCIHPWMRTVVRAR